MPGQPGSEQKGEGVCSRKIRYVNSDLVQPCISASFYVAESDLAIAS